MFPLSFKGNTEFNVLYFSDVHAKSHNIRHFKTAVDKFDRDNKGSRTLKLAGGDLNMDTAMKPNMLLLKLMDLIGLDASSAGNHDLEGGNYWAEAIEKIKPKFKFLSANLNFSRPNKLQDKIAKSAIIERKGEKVGVIGISPIDYKNLAFLASFNDYVNVTNFSNTVKSVKKEIKQLEKQGINKIFLLAHTGKASKKSLEFYEKLAQIGGIDIIIGGHDHKEYDNWYISERGEPVKVVSVGKAEGKDITGENLDSFGILKAIFNDDGVLIPEKCKNNVEITQNYPISQVVLDIEEKYLQANKVIGFSDRDLTCKNKMAEENPVGSLAADAMLWTINKTTKGQKAQIAFVNSGTVRNNIYKGDITIGSVMQALPFTSTTLIKTDLTKKQIINTLNKCAKSTTFSKIAPGVMQVGGLIYTIGSNNKAKDVYLLNKDGSLGERLDDQPDDKKYTVAYDIYLMLGPEGLSELKKAPTDPSVEYYSFCRQNALIRYLKNNFKNKPIEIKTKRIFLEPAKTRINN